MMSSHREEKVVIRDSDDFSITLNIGTLYRLGDVSIRQISKLT